MPNKKIQLENKIRSVESLLKDSGALSGLFGNGSDIVKRGFKIIKSREDELANRRDIKLEPKEFDVLDRSTKLFLNYALEEKITPIFRELSRSYLPLVDLTMNLSEKKNQDPRGNIKAVLVLLSQDRTLEETFVVMKKLLAKAKLFQEYEPPSFQLSKEYLKQLEKEDDTEK